MVENGGVVAAIVAGAIDVEVGCVAGRVVVGGMEVAAAIVAGAVVTGMLEEPELQPTSVEIPTSMINRKRKTFFTF